MTAIILAGGKSRGMGFNKAFLPYDKKTFIEHQIARLKTIFDEIIISANDAGIYAHLNLPVVSDIMPGKGPLGGIGAGLIRSASHHAFVVACDMPFVNPALLRYMLDLCAGDAFDVIVPRTEGYPEGSRHLQQNRRSDLRNSFE